MHYARSTMEVLQLDISGRPQAWVSAKEAAVIYATDGIAWTLGDPFFVLRGGTQRRTGLQSRIEVHPIIAVRGSVPSRAWRQTPALSNPKLFARDRHICNGEIHSSIPIEFLVGACRSPHINQSNNAIPACWIRPHAHPRIRSRSDRACGQPGRASAGALPPRVRQRWLTHD